MLAHSTRANDQLVRAALRSDLVIAAQSDVNDERYDQIGLQNDLILKSGRPVLIIPPNQAEGPFGSKILVAWNATRESASAINGGMPFIKRADEVVVLTVLSSQRRERDLDIEGHELAAHLARHGAKPVVAHVEKSKPSTGEQILDEAKAAGCDLIVMGGFGHTRLHEFVFGDVTRFMLKRADLPILVAG